MESCLHKAVETQPSRVIMRTLAMVANTLWPALPVPDHVPHRDDPLVQQYWAESADASATTMHQVKTAMDTYLPTHLRSPLFLVLRLLSWRLFTFLLAGRHSLSRRWPFVLSFPEMSLEAREATLLAWSTSRLPPLRQAFRGLRAFILSALFSNVDGAFQSGGGGSGSGSSNSGSTLWRIMGYPGPDGVPVLPKPPAAMAAEAQLTSVVTDLREVVAATPSGGGRAHSEAMCLRLSQRGYPARAVTAEDRDLIATAGAGCCGGWRARRRRAPGSDMDLSDEARNLAAVIEVDAVVVGSGAGGGVAAARLTEAGMRVMVVEKSTYMRMADMTHLEAEAMPAMYEQAGYMTTHDGGVSILAGSTLGGGTKVNWAAALRTPDIVRKEWSERLGLADLAGPAFDEALDAVVERLGVGRHTSSGRPTDDNMCHGGQNAALLKGLCAVGADATEYPRNCSEQVCSAFCALGCKHGFKQSSDVTWLADAAATGHLHVLTSATALRVLHVDAAADAFKAAGTSSNSNKPGDHHTSSGGVGGTGGGSGGTGSTGGNGSHHHAGGAEPAGTVAHQRRSRVAGVLLTCTPSAVQAAAGAQPEGAVTPVHVLVRCGVVVSSAGTLHTPALLLRSGINGGGSVGRNLRLHPSTVVVARFPPDAALHLPCQPCDIEALSAGRVNKVQDAHTSAMKRPERGSAGGACSPGSVQMWEGPMMSALSREVSNWEDPGGQGYGSLLSVAVAHPGMLAANFPWLSGAFAKEALMHIKHSALMLVIVRDRDSGRVTIDDAGRPVVDYWPSQHDCESMIKGIELCVRAAVAAGASDVCTLQAGPAAHFKVTDATVKGTAGRTDRTAGGTSGGTGATAGEAADETSGAAGGTAGGTSGAAGRTAGRTMGGTIRTAGGTHVEDDSTPLQSAGRQDDESQQLEDLSRRLDDLSGRRDDPSRRPDDQSRRLDAYLAGVRRIGVRKYDMGVLTAHQMCSARLGVSPKSSVCDPSGECWEVAGLYVCDASVLPTCSGSNPMVTTEAMAWLLAGRLADAWKARRSGPSGPHDGRLVRGQASVPERRLGGGGGAGRSAEKPRRRTAAQVLQYEECREPDR